jgi:hypothetical protein
MPLPSFFNMRIRRLDDFIQNSSQTAIIAQKHTNEVYSRLKMYVDSKFDNETIKEKTLSIEKNLDDSFRKKFQIHFKDIKILNEIHDRQRCIVTKSLYETTNTKVVTKSYRVESGCVQYFHNEILVHKIISECYKREYFSELIGFILGIETFHAFYGTIVLKWYNMPDLHIYAQDINSVYLRGGHEKLKDEKKLAAPKEIRDFLDIAHQIARGKNFLLYGYFLLFFGCMKLNENIFF